MAKPVTRKDVALSAGVSETIVSYVINNNRYVDKNKRERVEEAIKKLQYRPNAIARSLKSKKSNHIVFLADKIDNEHFGKLIQEMESSFYSKGYFISLTGNRNDDDFIQHIVSRQYDGVIISSISIDEKRIQTLVNAGIPLVVLMNRTYPYLDESIGKIYPGLLTGAERCVRHLYDGGSRNIIYIDRISERENFSDMSDLRLRGYAGEMEKLGLGYNPDNVITGLRNAEELAREIRKRFSRKERPDGIFARNDNMAAVAMTVLRGMDIKIPEETAVIGFDNSNLSRYTSPALTTMEINRSLIASTAVTMMEKLMAGEKVSPAELQTKLIIRESTRS